MLDRLLDRPVEHGRVEVGGEFLRAWLAVRPPADRGALLAASVVLAVGLLLFTARGPRTRLSDDA
jgi:hypothetical protein